jgi:hypothetical protein
VFPIPATAARSRSVQPLEAARCTRSRREVIAEIEREWTARLGAGKMRRLRELLQELNDGL